MKYCLNSICDKKTLSKADEIRLAANDDIFDFIEKYPKAKLIVPYPSSTPLKELQQYAKLNRIILSIRDFEYLKIIKENHLPWFYDAPVNNFFDLNSLVRLGSFYVLLDGLLFHSLDKVRDVLISETTIRIIPNVAYWPFIPAPSAIPTQWVRPEDLQALEYYNITIEFGDCEGNHKKEEALYRVYKEGKWSGDIKNLITNFNYNADNELIPPSLIENRINCGQRCQSGSSCHICYRYLQMANRDFINKVKNS